VEDRRRRFGPWRVEIRSFVELLALTGVAIAQPAFDLLEKNVALFVTERTSKAQTIGLTLVLILVPPTVLWLVEVAAGLVLPRVRRWVHAAFAGGIAGIVAIEVLKPRTSIAPSRLVVVAAVVALGVAFCVLRFDVVRMFLRYLAFAPVIFALMFLFFSPVTDVVFGDQGAAAAKVTVGQPNRVVMVVMDEFPIGSLLDGTGHIDSTLFPNFAALAADSTWYRNDSTVAPYTDQAVPAILTGDYPTDPSKPPAVTGYPHNLFTLLGNSYEMNVHESITHLCPDHLCTESNATHGGFQKLLYDTVYLWRHFAAPDRTGENLGFDNPEGEGEKNAIPIGEQFVRSLTPTNRPRLDFLHVLLPHWPWHYLPVGKRQDFETLEGVFGATWTSPWSALSGRQRHLLQVQAADRLVGDIVARLRKIHAYDNSLVVFTTDHGIAFTSGTKLRGPTPENHPQIMWTPLMIKSPGQGGGVVSDGRARSIDVLPTIAAELEVKLPWKTDGQSLLGAPIPDGPRRIFRWSRRAKRPSGNDYLTFDGPTGFAAAMQSQASAAGGDPTLRLYRIGPYGSLVGRDVGNLVGATASPLTAQLTTGDAFRRVDPTADYVPWAYIAGDVDCQPAAVPLAITVNGVVAGLSQTSVRAFTNECRFWSELAPSLFRKGSNQVSVYAVSGTAEAPQLALVKTQGLG
jgi:Sulfatase